MLLAVCNSGGGRYERARVKRLRVRAHDRGGLTPSTTTAVTR